MHQSNAKENCYQRERISKYKMPLKIVFKLQPQMQQSYAIIGQTGYGRMDETTPLDGLATFGASSCTVIITHCAELKRTTLTHTPNYMFVKQTLEPIFNWTVAKGENKFNETNSFEVVVMRGYLYRDQQLSANFNHRGFMKKLRDFIGVTYESHSVDINDTDPLLQSSNGSLLVDKSTAKITVLQLPLQLDAHDKLPTSSYNHQQLMRDIFAGDLFPFVYPNNGNIITSRHLQFDVNQYTLHGKISDHCRLVLRARCSLNCSDKELQCLLMSMNIYIDPTIFAQLKQTLESPASSGLPCERCPDKGLMKCSNCRGAWYCDRAHQREDWSEHMRFCRLYSLKK